MTSKLRGEDGYATIAATGIIVAIVSLLLVIAAVAGAWALATGQDPCAAAESTARENGASLEECTDNAPDIIAVAAVRGQSATAKAGPV